MNNQRKQGVLGHLSDFFAWTCLIIGSALVTFALSGLLDADTFLARNTIWSLLISGGVAIIFGIGVNNREAFKLARSKHKHVVPGISEAPGGRLLAVVEYLYSPKTVEQVFKPIIADWRTEYFNALKEGRTRKAAWINVRYYFGFGMAMGLSKILSAIRSAARR